MKKSLFILCFFIATFRADAREVALNYENIRLTQYQQHNDGESRLQYTIRANQLNEIISLQATLGSFNRAGASQKKHFNDGTLTLKNSEIQFERAYFHRGQLIMENCRGIIQETAFLSKEIVYDSQNNQILSPRITFSSGSSLRSKMNYSTQIDPA
ncbi:hypothetical protein [Endozoicomonas lisbonensis]|uniref:Organic solvent tolerance-like N-terminal domain-containing protein n=1 Tax=Endozoicomonas lisbonensis TaxID=3120522 RepID=A0ABV2SEA4_9GAMM